MSRAASFLTPKKRIVMKNFPYSLTLRHGPESREIRTAQE